MPTTEAPADLTRDDKLAVLAWAAKKYPWMQKATIRFECSQCLNHHGSKGTKHKSWVRACYKWIDKAVHEGWIKQAPPMTSAQEQLHYAGHRKAQKREPEVGTLEQVDFMEVFER